MAVGMLEGNERYWVFQGKPYIHFERKHMTNLLKRLWKEEEGQDLTEYGLLLVLVALAALASMGTLANAINNAFSRAASSLTSST
jgi:pilus assembly protein Flp/PilA